MLRFVAAAACIVTLAAGVNARAAVVYSEAGVISDSCFLDTCYGSSFDIGPMAFSDWHFGPSFWNVVGEGRYRYDLFIDPAGLDVDGTLIKFDWGETFVGGHMVGSYEEGPFDAPLDPGFHATAFGFSGDFTVGGPFEIDLGASPYPDLPGRMTARGVSYAAAGAHIELPAYARDRSYVFQITAIPEPAGWALMIGGTFTLGAALRRRRRLAPAAV